MRQLMEGLRLGLGRRARNGFPVFVNLQLSYEPEITARVMKGFSVMYWSTLLRCG